MIPKIESLGMKFICHGIVSKDSICFNHVIHGSKYSILSSNARVFQTQKIKPTYNILSYRFSSNKNYDKNFKNLTSALKFKQKYTAQTWALTGIAGFVSAILGYLVTKNYFDIEEPDDDIDLASELKEVSKTDIFDDTMRKYPDCSDKIPNDVKYLIIGGGASAFAACRTIKSRDVKAKILMITEDSSFPYMKPPLSKELLMESRLNEEELLFMQWNGKRRSIFFENKEYYTLCEELEMSDNGGISVARGWRSVCIDPVEKTVTLEDGKRIKYDKCLLATGFVPKMSEELNKLFEDVPHKVTYYHTLKDLRQIEAIISNGAKSIMVIGADVLGCELAVSLAQREKDHKLKVTQVVPQSQILDNLIPDYLSKWLIEKMNALGIDLFNNVEVIDFSLLGGDQMAIQLSNGRTVVIDHLLVSLGSEPNVTIAKESGLEVDEIRGGFLVNPELELRSDLFAAGDCASVYDVSTGRRIKLTGYDYAIASGRLAGENMTGARKPLTYIPMYWSDMGVKMGFEAVGNVKGGLKTTGYFAEQSSKNYEALVNMDPSSSLETTEQLPSTDYSKGIVFYLNDDGILVGIVMWNLYNRLALARQIIGEKRTEADLLEIVKLFKIYED